MTREYTVEMIKAIKNGLHETGKDFPYRDEIIPIAKEALDEAIKALKEMENLRKCVNNVSCDEYHKDELFAEIDRRPLTDTKEALWTLICFYWDVKDILTKIDRAEQPEVSKTAVFADDKSSFYGFYKKRFNEIQ